MQYLIVGNDPYKTSTFSKITKQIINILSKDKNNNIFCLSKDFSETRSYENVIISGPISNLEQQLSFYSTYLKPKICILIGNLEDFLFLGNYFKNNYLKFPIIGVLNINTMPLTPYFLSILGMFNNVLLYSSGIYEFLKTIGLPNIKYSPLGVDKNLFYSIPNQKEIYNKNFENEIFSIISPGSNSKNNYKTCLIEAFSNFSKNKEEVYLYFSDRNDEKYFKVEDFIWKYPWIKEKILISQDQQLFKSNLNNIYNTANLCINTDINSCYNLSTLESMYCGCHNVITDNLFNQINNYPISNSIIKIKSNNFIEPLGNHLYIPDFKDLVDIIEKSYNLYKENKLNRLNITKELEHYFSWEEFNNSLEYILSVNMNNNIKIGNILL